MEFTDHLTDDHIAMIAKQAVFFVATAAAEGRINLSPKGLADTFRVLGPNRVAWLDLGGSGNETHAHLAAAQTDRGRITVIRPMSVWAAARCAWVSLPDPPRSR